MKAIQFPNTFICQALIIAFLLEGVSYKSSDPQNKKLMILIVANFSWKASIRLSLLCNSYINKVNSLCYGVSWCVKQQFIWLLKVTSKGDCFCGSVFLLLMKMSKPLMRPDWLQVTELHFCNFLLRPLVTNMTSVCVFLLS